MCKLYVLKKSQFINYVQSVRCREIPQVSIYFVCCINITIIVLSRTYLFILKNFSLHVQKWLQGSSNWNSWMSTRVYQERSVTTNLNYISRNIMIYICYQIYGCSTRFTEECPWTQACINFQCVGKCCIFFDVS